MFSLMIYVLNVRHLHKCRYFKVRFAVLNKFNDIQLYREDNYTESDKGQLMGCVEQFLTQNRACLYFDLC